MYQPHSETSREAFRSFKGRGTMADRIHRHIEGKGAAGVTAGWIAKDMDIQTGTLSARLIELERDNRIIKLKRTEENPNGKRANIYVSSYFAGRLLAGDEPEKTKAEKKADATPAAVFEKNTAVVAAREILSDVDTFIALGTPILPGSTLHNRILNFLKG